MLNRCRLGVRSGTIAGAIACLAAASAMAQVVDTKIPLNYNFHGMAHQGEGVPGATANNADFIYYRSMSDRGLYWDPADSHAFGTSPMVGYTGITYGLFDTLGYVNETAINPGDAANYQLDMVHLGDRGVFYRIYDNDPTSLNGPYPPWQPNANTNSNHTGDQVTVLSSPVTVDALSEIGVLYEVSDSGGQFDCVLTFNNGSTDTNVTVRLAAPDWFGVPADPAIVSGQPVSSQRKLPHVVSGTTYNSFRAVQGNDSANLQTFVTGGGGPNLNVIEGIISVGSIIAGGNNVAGQQLTRITFRNAAWSTTRTISTLVGDGTTATATCSTAAAFVPGQIVTISGAAVPGFNGTYTVTSMGPSTSVTGITSTTTIWTVTTATPHGLVAGNNIYIAGADQAAYNGSFNVGTVIDANNFTVANTSNPGPSTGTITVSNSRVFTFANSTSGSNTGTCSALAVGRDRGYAIFAVTARTGIPQRANCATAEVVGVGDTPSNNQRCSGGTASGYGVNDTTVAWYAYTATTTGDIEARTCGAAIDTTVAILNSCGGTPIAGNDNGGCGTGSRVRWSAIQGHTYLIRVAGNNATQGAYTLHIDDPAHVDITMPLAFNWNGIVNGQNEQTLPDPAGTTYENRCDLNGYRAIADRGLLCDGIQTNALNYGGGAVGYNGMFYRVYGTDHQSDMIHMGNRTIAAGGIRNWSTTCPQGTTNGNGLRPTWLNNDDQTTPQASDLSAFGAVFGPSTMIGILYHVSNVDTGFFASFDVTLNFTDGSTVTVRPQATDWFGTNTQVLPGHNNTDGSGLETQRVLGIYHGTSNTDRATDGGGTVGALKIDEAVISTASLQNIGFDPTGKTLQFITFQNFQSGHAAIDSTYSALGIYSATLRDPLSYNQNFGPGGLASINVNPVTVGGSARMQVAVSRGGGSPNNITSVTINASSINQGTITLNDSGTNGDVNPNDNTWSRTVVFPINSTPGNAHLPFTVTDAQNRTFTGDLSFGINGPSGSANPSSVAQSGTTLITVPLFPNSGGATDISIVSVDASSIQSGTLNLNDSGANGDVTAGDGIWSGTLAVYGGATLGPATLPLHIQDVSGRFSDLGTVSVTITAAPIGACCTAGTCSLLSQFNCVNGGGTFQGVGTNCGVPSYAITDAGSAYASIASTGTLATNVTDCDDCVQNVLLPFSFTFFENAYSDVWISSNGNVQFGAAASTAYTNDNPPSALAPNNAIYPMWDDLAPNTQGDIYYEVDGVAPNRTFTVEWFNCTQFAATTSENFQVVLHETSNTVEFRYGSITPDAGGGGGPGGSDYTVGVENSDGTLAYTIPGANLGSGNITKTVTFVPGTNPCGPSTGSCCTNNTCTITTQADCAGTWTAGGVCTGPASCNNGHFCGSADFNCDGSVGTDQDIEGFFACLSGNCPPLPCISNADFDGDGSVGTDHDISAFFSVLGGGNC